MIRTRKTGIQSCSNAQLQKIAAKKFQRLWMFQYFSFSWQFYKSINYICMFVCTYLVFYTYLTARLKHLSLDNRVLMELVITSDVGCLPKAVVIMVFSDLYWLPTKFSYFSLEPITFKTWCTCMPYSHIYNAYLHGHVRQQITFQNESIKNAKLFISQQTLWCDHSLKSSRRDDISEGHTIEFGWEMRKLSRNLFCSISLTCSPDTTSLSQVFGLIDEHVVLMSRRIIRMQAVFKWH